MNLISIIMPAKDEKSIIGSVISDIQSSLNYDFECLVVVDHVDDETVQVVKKFESTDSRIKLLINPNKKNPTDAIKYGLKSSRGNAIVLMMADGSDRITDINLMAKFIFDGIDLVCASRYIPGGRQIGSKGLKPILSKLAGKLIFLLTKVDTHDSTNSFKGMSRKLLDKIEIESTRGFTIGLELVAKCKKLNMPISEFPTIWTERKSGKSNFRLFKWLPNYIYWFIKCIVN
jgi:glycosyltransferase involved in cell wall biosynthesis